MTPDDLSPDQRAVYDEMTRWAARPSGILTVGGYAGTGKSSILGVLAPTLGPRIAYAAFTGRAASVLRRKLAESGVDSTSETGKYARTDVPFCGTLHQLMFKPAVDEQTDELLGFGKRDAFARPYRFVIVDEAAMVSDLMLEQLKSFGTPILAVGDHGQLPPVMGSGELMRRPMLRLEQIHRQALGSPIVRLAHAVRTTGKLQIEDHPNTVRVPKTKLDETLSSAGLRFLSTGTLCWRNKTRVFLNRRARHVLGHEGSPAEGELVVCLKNRPPIYNGMRGRFVENATKNAERPWLLHAKLEFPEEVIPADEYTLCVYQFHRENTFVTLEEMQRSMPTINKMGSAGALYDFGYALTTHKSQGSQFEHVVLVLDRHQDPDSEDWRRWAYTSVTRSSERLTVVG